MKRKSADELIRGGLMSMNEEGEEEESNEEMGGGDSSAISDLMDQLEQQLAEMEQALAEMNGSEKDEEDT